VGIALIPLLRKQLQVTTLQLDEPTLTIRRNRDGTFNVSKVLGPLVAKDFSHRLFAASGEVNQGALVFRDEISGSKVEIGGLALGFEMLRRDASGRPAFTASLRAGHLRVNDIEMQNLTGRLYAQGGEFRVEPLRLRAFGGGVEGSLSANLSEKWPRYRVEFLAERLSLTKLYRDLVGKELLEGEVSMQAELSTHGPGSMVNGLNGRVKITGSDIILHGFDLDGFIEDYRASQSVDLVDIGSYLFAGPIGALIRKSYEMEGMYRNLKEGEKEILDEIDFNWTIENGLARAEDVAFRTRENRVSFKGNIDLRRRRYDGFTLGLLDQKGCAEMTEEITGPLASPTVKKTALVSSLAGPLAGVLSKTLEILDPRECKPFYSGRVRHPQH
jgi:uncharacterized protein involved in outer membrane biogenesis